MSEKDKASSEKPPSSDGAETPTVHHDVGDNSILQSLAKTIGQDPRLSLRSGGEQEGPVVRTNSKELDGATHRGGCRYRLDGEIARGGMGAILKGRDADLGRDLAIKILLGKHSDRPDVIQRFVEEAQIGGQLQHPGIVPVHELGQFEDGRPFFTMKLVKGKTLEALLVERKSTLADRARFLGIFEQICQTMAYAHSRGVIHRDLKPANIMVGAFGEVQVMDWGLAKVLAEGGVADERRGQEDLPDVSVIHTIRSRGSDVPDSDGTGTGSHTMAGSVLGTPAYMPPEQAIGEVDRLDERTDVFALGAILCKIFTGKPPYVGKDHQEVFQNATRANLEDCYRRLDECNLDAELRKLALDCLQTEPNDRPQNAGAVANQIEAYVESAESRLREAQLEKVKADTQVVEERKRRIALMGLAASVLATLIIGGGGWIWLKQKDAALAKANADAQIKTMEQRSKLSQQIGQELSTAQALGVAELGELPDPLALRRAFEAIERAKVLIKESEVDEKLSTEVIAFHTKLSAIKSDQDLVDRLEQAWEREMQYRGQRNASGALGNMGANRPPKDEAEVREREAVHPRHVYNSAFSNWGLDVDNIGPAAATKKLHSLPPNLQHFAFASLDRWQALLREQTYYWQWLLRDWSTLDHVNLRSRGGDNFEVLEDQSILVSGDNPYAGYELEFETDCRVLSALRLEALLHDSLPNGGPGRSSTGSFGIYGLEVYWAPRSDSSAKQRLELSDAVADYSWVSDDITVDGWNITGRSGEPHTAFFEVTEPPQSEAGFHVWIKHEDRPRGNWEDQNLGRFRWSATPDANNRRVNRVRSHTIEAIVESADPNAWRNALRRELANHDALALIRRANDEQGCADQPNAILVQLADALRRIRGNQLLDAISKSINWQVAEPENLQSKEGVTLKIQPDNSVIASGLLPDVDTVSVTAQVSQEPVTAIRLEFLPELRSDGYPEKNIGRVGDLVLRECTVSAHPAGNDREMGEKELDVDFAFANDDWWNSVAEVFDGDGNTFRSILKRRQPRSIVLVLKPFAANLYDSLTIGIQSGYGPEHTVSRFRVALTTDTFPAANVQKSALNLLERMCYRDPTDYWVRLELSRSYRNQFPPQLEDAFQHANAAIALQPDQLAGHEAMLRATQMNNARHDDRTGRIVRDHYRRVWELDANHRLTKRIVELAYRTASERAREHNYEQARSSLQLAKQLEALAPQDGMNGYWFNIWAWQLIVDPDQYQPSEVADIAVTLAERAVELAPEYHNAANTLGVAYCLAEQWADAITILNAANQMREDGRGYEDWLFLAKAHWHLNHKEEAKEWLRKAISNMDVSEQRGTAGNAGDKLKDAPEREDANALENGSEASSELNPDAVFMQRTRDELQKLMKVE